MAVPESSPMFPWRHGMTLSARLKAVRAVADVSREIAVERCGKGFSERTWGRWETELDPNDVTKGPTVAQLRRIADEFDVDFRWLALGAIVDTGRYPISVQSRLPLADGWDHLDGERFEWKTRQSLTDTESGNGHGDSHPKRSVATAPSIDRSSPGSLVAA